MLASRFQPTASDDRSTEFVPVQGGTETTSAGTMLVVAYLFMWAILLGFVLLTWLRQKALNRRISELERSLAAARPVASERT